MIIPRAVAYHDIFFMICSSMVFLKSVTCSLNTIGNCTSKYSIAISYHDSATESLLFLFFIMPQNHFFFAKLIPYP